MNRLSRHLQRDLGALHHGSIGKRGQETAGDEVVQLVLGGRQVVRRGLGGGIDRRVVGGLLLAAGGVDGLGKDGLAGGGIGRVSGNGAHHVGQIQRGRVHRVVHAGIRDVAIHVQAFGNAHGARRGEPLG